MNWLARFLGLTIKAPQAPRAPNSPPRPDPRTAPDFVRRVHAIAWDHLDEAYNGTRVVRSWPTFNVPLSLIELASPVREIAMDGCDSLQSDLTHQHVWLSRAMLPAFPFIMEVFERADDKLRIEILHILAGCARTGFRTASGWPDWVGSIREELRARLSLFQSLTTHPEPDLSDLAQLIVEILESGREDEMETPTLNR
jgi:hypothetical protein